MKKANVDILGYGFVQSVFHMPCYKEIPEANVIAVEGRRLSRSLLITGE